MVVHSSAAVWIEKNLVDCKIDIIVNIPLSQISERNGNGDSVF